MCVRTSRERETLNKEGTLTHKGSKESQTASNDLGPQINTTTRRLEDPAGRSVFKLEGGKFCRVCVRWIESIPPISRSGAII